MSLHQIASWEEGDDFDLLAKTVQVCACTNNRGSIGGMDKGLSLLL